jgi:hypothetical protein
MLEVFVRPLDKRRDCEVLEISHRNIHMVQYSAPFVTHNTATVPTSRKPVPERHLKQRMVLCSM